jgi:hypothetical protein
MDPLKERLYKKCNEMRQEKGRKPFQYDDRLEKAAQAMADNLTRGAAPHARLRQRIEESGFPLQNDCLISRRSMMANYTEGILDAPKGMDIDEKSPEYLVGGGPGEGHYDDFFDPLINYIGIGVAVGRRMSYFVIDYGRLCRDFPGPKPTPTPTPSPDPQPLPESFFDMLRRWLRNLFGHPKMRYIKCLIESMS